MKKALTFFLALAIMCSLVPAALAGWEDSFVTVKEYEDGTFKDVPANAWYLSAMVKCYETDLIRGKSATAFVPEGNITIAETVAIAARIFSIRTTGRAEFTQGSPWYRVYMDYADGHGIIQAEDYTDPNQPITRREFAGILNWSMDNLSKPEINQVDDRAIPDVPKDDPRYDEIYKLYRAGVLTGSDSKGTFRPDDPITRSEAAAIVARLIDPSLRKTITLRYEGLRYWRHDMGGVTFAIPMCYELEGASKDLLQMVANVDGAPASVLMITTAAEAQSEGWYYELQKRDVCDLLLDGVAESAGAEPAADAEYTDITLAGLSGMAASRDYGMMVEDVGITVPVRILAANSYDPAADTVIAIVVAVIAPELREVDYTAEFWKLLETAVPAD